MKHSLLANLPDCRNAERFETLCATAMVRIERIVSRGQRSPDGFWYDQETHEFVTVLQGSAGLRLEGQDDVIVLNTGDCLDIPAHLRHRVEWTDADQETVWLAVHYRQDPMATPTPQDAAAMRRLDPP